ncbi:MAG: glucuronate isomerase [Verrucomicrobiota bacterium]
MDTFITGDFLLKSRTAKKLYHDYVENLPIVDYHCHLSPRDIAENRQYQNLYEVWMEADHYKWRAMRANGISEKYILGNGDDYDKYMAFARTVPKTLRNPLYHWTHLELMRYFGIEELLNEDSAHSIWEQANAQIQSESFRAQALLRRFKVEVLCTTDDPVDTLDFHGQQGSTKVLPTFRPDQVLGVNSGQLFINYLEKLEVSSGIACRCFDGMLEALKKRHDYFHTKGCRLSDHGMKVCPRGPASGRKAAQAFHLALAGQEISDELLEAYQFTLMLELGRWDAEKNWTKQLHLGVMRNNSSRLFAKLGSDTGFDSISDASQGDRLCGYLDALDATDQLPKTIVYNLNPADNYLIAAILGNFQNGSIPGKMQFGSGWWFLDQKEGMQWQMNALSSLGLLSRFVGMLTDSRSLLSFPRHEYFRRILCNLVGQDADAGELPQDLQLLSELVQDVSYRNANKFFEF